MSIWRLILREIMHRKLSFLLGVLSVSIAVGSLIGAMTLLEADRIQTEQVLARHETLVNDAGVELEDAMRKITIGLGFNILVLPERQNLNELHVQGAPTETMPEEYVDRLAESKIVTVNHLLPIVSRRVDWKEVGRTVIVTGTRGEVPQMHRASKKPLQDQVPAGTIAVGYAIHTPDPDQPSVLAVGDQVTLLEREFKVTTLQPERGTIDDSTVWINLAEAQELFGLQNLVHAILALECNCAAADRVGEIRSEIQTVLPGTRIIERQTSALARAEARNTAKKTAEENRDRAVVQRNETREQRESFSALLVPLIVFGAAAWIGLLAWTNVRQRRTEIGILRAIGLRSGQLLLVFLGKALVMGLLGAAVGWACGYELGFRLAGFDPASVDVAVDGAHQLLTPTLGLTALIAAPLLSGLASWLPALVASREDPALILAGE